MPEILKLLEERTGKTLQCWGRHECSEQNFGSTGTSPKYQEMRLHGVKQLHSKRNHQQNKQRAYNLEENLHLLFFRQMANIQHFKELQK